MKNIYNKSLNIIFNMIRLLEMLKNIIFEKLYIIKRKNQYSSCMLAKDEKQALDEFWKKAYGRKIPDRWHRLYKSFSTKFDEKFFPAYLYSIHLEDKLNPWSYCKVLSDKNLLNTLFSDSVYCPDVYAMACDGIFWGKEKTVCSYNELIEQLRNIGKVVIKETVGSSSGKGVQICDFCDGVDTISGQSVKDIVSMFYPNFNIQKCIEQSDEISAIYSGSLNTCRVITYIANDKIHCAPLTMRIGRGGKFVDNIHSGGLVIGLENDGSLKEFAYLESGERFDKHPDTDFKFAGYRVNGADRLIDTALKLHAKVPQLGMISWDFAIDKNHHPVLIEMNLRGQSVWFAQMTHGKGIFEENTDYMIGLIKRRK